MKKKAAKKKSRVPELTAQQMAAARLLVAGKAHKQVAAEVGINPRTLTRHMNRPDFLAYQEQVRAEVNAEMRAETKAEIKRMPITFTFDDAAQRYMNIADSTTNDFCRLKAIDSLVALFGVAKAPAAALPGEQLPEKPNIFKADWMQ